MIELRSQRPTLNAQWLRRNRCIGISANEHRLEADATSKPPLLELARASFNVA